VASYGELWRARLQLLRPGNAVMAAVGVAVGAALLEPSSAMAYAALPAALAAFLITAYGNVLNDIVDVDVDREGHPERPLPSGRISIGQAKATAALLLALGLWEGFVAAGLRTFLFAVATVALLGLYEWRLKGTGLAGNVVVATLVASTFAFGALTASPDWRAWGMVWALAVMAFLANVARELLKDIQDLEADRERRSTFPMQAGRPVTLLLAFFLVQAAVVLSALAWWQAPWPRLWGIPLLAADIVFVIAASIAWMDVRQAQLGLKLAMLLALAAFLAGALQH